tara:strand:- start:542 stop:772 length:231 start_codon:yes stop_codon:yes gene_type:complete
MDNKGFKVNSTVLETPYTETNTKKPSNFKGKQSQKVDINVLIARAQEIQSKENKKNIFIFLFFLLILGTIGIYLSS